MTFLLSYAFFRQCRKFSTLPQKSIRREKSYDCKKVIWLFWCHMTFSDYAFFSIVSGTSDSVEKKHSREKSHMTFSLSYDFFRRMLFFDSVENFRHCRKKAYDSKKVIWLFYCHMTFRHCQKKVILKTHKWNFFGIHCLYIQIDPISYVLHVSMIHAVSDSVAKF